MNHPQLQSKGTQYEVMSVFTKDSVLGSPTDHDWKRMRKLTSKAFSNNVMNNVNKNVHDMMTCKVYPFLDQLAEEGKEIDVKDLMSPLALDVLGRIAFSYNVGGLDMLLNNNNQNDGSTNTATSSYSSKRNGNSKKELYQVFSEICEDQQISLRLGKRIARIIDWLPMRRMKSNIQLLNDTITDVLQRRISESIKDEEKEKSDLLGYLLEKDENGNPILSPQELLGNTRSFLFAGHDTTAISMTFALYELSRKTDIIQKLRLEIDPLFLKPDGANEIAFPSYGQLRSCSYLESVVREVLRLHAPAAFSRVAQDFTEVTLETSKYKYILPSGTDVMVAPWLTHRLDATMQDEDLLVFDPDRRVKNSEAYFPFAIGSRNCVGRELALAEMRAVIACMVHTYDFEPPSEEVVTFARVTLNPNQCKMTFKRRTF